MTNDTAPSRSGSVTATPSTRRRAATRGRLLDAAREVLAADGIQGASVEHICECAGFTRGAFYSNFTSKEDLLLALFHREREQMFDSLKVATEPDAFRGLGPEAAISVIIDRFLGLEPVDRDWYLVHLEFSIRGIRRDEVGEEFNAAWREVKADLVALMEVVMAALGRRFTIDPAHAAIVLMGTYDEALREALSEGRGLDPDLLHTTLPVLLLAGTSELDDPPPDTGR